LSACLLLRKPGTPFGWHSAGDEEASDSDERDKSNADNHLENFQGLEVPNVLKVIVGVGFVSFVAVAGLLITG
jgi:hypothetical protein